MLDMKAIAQMLLKNPGAFPQDKSSRNSIFDMPVRGHQKPGNFQTGWKPRQTLGQDPSQVISLRQILGR